jgi:hypothetical protein
LKIHEHVLGYFTKSDRNAQKATFFFCSTREFFFHLPPTLPSSVSSCFFSEAPRVFLQILLRQYLSWKVHCLALTSKEKAKEGGATKSLKRLLSKVFILAVINLKLFARESLNPYIITLSSHRIGKFSENFPKASTTEASLRLNGFI